ncbi:adenosylcobinamide-GDP ribazoletransferase [Treponema sp. OMZ 792]|uniref:adenosylcobinamide-GDP ribazoletransferase n=1 Tax=unclassified Treponema TaxID=2638727 RepID=UPI0020A460D2|nr:MULTISPECIES: adenosylcobinamide-GDP ribazoletransferase [unclassified Treponema]UTC75509.1 adenosylcobinamide-GDP ribazoletransferase [Treponema sp. OMZ 792]UTC79513.1 adenosylcobinamide-GDP ribazoletransferase [Treponema sp. OMZ 798]
MKGFILALQFFTRIPININVDFNEKNIKRAFYFFPLIGALIASLVLIPIYFLPQKYLEISGFLSLLLYLFLTGSIHLDGVGDTVDGFFSARKKEKILEIMQDPRIGTYGTIGLNVFLLLRYINYSTIMPDAGLLILAGIISRLSGLAVVVFSKPAKDTGLGALFHKAASKAGFFFWLIIVCILSLFAPEIAAFSKIQGAFILTERIKYLLFPAIALILTFIVIRISYKKIGGTTGDVNGFIVELTELAVLSTSFFITVHL